MRTVRSKFYPGFTKPDTLQRRDIDLLEVIRLLCEADLPLLVSISGTVGGRVELVLRKSYIDYSHEEVNYYGSEQELNELLRFVRIAKASGCPNNEYNNWRIDSVMSFFELDGNKEIERRYESYAVFREFLALAELAHTEGMSLAETAAALA